jgi:hypothetical protein
MDLMFHHQAQPFPDRNPRPIGRSALPQQSFISKARKNLNRLAVKRLSIRHDFFITVGQLSPATRVAAALTLNCFREHVTFDRSDVANQISKAEFAFTKRPLQFVRRNALHNPGGSLVNSVEIFQQPINRQDLHWFENRTLRYRFTRRWWDSPKLGFFSHPAEQPRNKVMLLHPRPETRHLTSQKRTARKLLSLRAARWTVWD